MTTAAQKGNNFTVGIATAFGGSTYEVIAAAQTTSLSFNKSSVDITNKDGAGWQELMPGGGLKSMSISGDGVFSDGTGQDRMREAFDAATHWNFEVTDQAGDTWTGPWNVDSFERSGDANAEERYSFTLSSADEITYAAA